MAVQDQAARGGSPAAKADAESKSVGEDIVSEQVNTKALNEDAALFPVTIPTLVYQGVMVLTMLYYGMLFSNWGDAVIAGENDNYYASNVFTQWVKIVSLWCTLALFTVSITLNICCKDRQL